MLIDRDNIFGSKIPAMRNFFHTLTLDGDKKNYQTEKRILLFFLRLIFILIHPNDFQTFGSYLTGNKLFLLLL
jgi:hypothetical protein